MVLRDGDGEDKGSAPRYEPVGVWVQGPGPGLDIEMFYIDSREPKVLERKDDANWVINRLVEAGVTSLPEDFLEYHRQSRSPYDGAFGEIVEINRIDGGDSQKRAHLQSHSVGLLGDVHEWECPFAGA